MTRSLESFSVKLMLAATVRNTLTDTSRIATAPISFQSAPTLATGDDENQANRGWEYSGTLASGASQVIDLFDLGSIDIGAGAGKDAVGQAFALDEIVAIAIINESSTPGDSDSDPSAYLEIIPDVTAGWTPIGSHTVATGGALQSGGVLYKLQIEDTAFPVTDGVSHRIKLTAVSGDVNFKILILGRES